VRSINIEWEDIQDYTDEQIEQLRQVALPRANGNNLSLVNFWTATHKDACSASSYKTPDLNEEAAYRIMKALMYAESSLALNSWNAKILKAMARAQRDNTRENSDVKVHSLVKQLDCGIIPVTRDVVLPASQMYSPQITPRTSRDYVIEWSVLNMDPQGEACSSLPQIEPKFTLRMDQEGSDVRDARISYSLVKYPHPTERDQSVLKIQKKEVSLTCGEELLGECKASAYGKFHCTVLKKKV